MTRELNTILYHEQKREGDFLKDHDAIRKVTKELRAENQELHGSTEDLTKLISRLIQRSGIAYLDGKKAFECVYRWTHGVLPGKYILERFENYFSGIFEPEFNGCIRKVFVDTRFWIIEKLRLQRNIR